MSEKSSTTWINSFAPQSEAFKKPRFILSILQHIPQMCARFSEVNMHCSFFIQHTTALNRNVSGEAVQIQIRHWNHLCTRTVSQKLEKVIGIFTYLGSTQAASAIFLAALLIASNWSEHAQSTWQISLSPFEQPLSLLQWESQGQPNFFDLCQSHFSILVFIQVLQRSQGF